MGEVTRTYDSRSDFTSKLLVTAEEHILYHHILRIPLCLSPIRRLNQRKYHTVDYFSFAPCAARHWVDYPQFMERAFAHSSGDNCH